MHTDIVKIHIKLFYKKNIRARQQHSNQIATDLEQYGNNYVQVIRLYFILTIFAASCTVKIRRSPQCHG